MTAHSILGPSSSDRWIACTRSVKATKDLADIQTLYARQGSCAHEVAELCREHGKSPYQYIGHKFHGVEVDQQMADCVQGFIDYVNDLEGDDYNEQRVYFTDWVEEGFGTMDAARVTKRAAHIIDLKYGEGVQVFAQENSQLMLYALGFYQAHGWLYDLQEFWLHVYQPRLDHVDKWRISLEDLLKWADEVVRPKAREALDGTGEFIAGEHCQFCKLKKTCKARAQHLVSAWTADLEELDAQLAAPPREVNKLTPAQIAKALSLKGQVTKWFSDLAGHAEDEIRAGRDVGGWKLVEGRSNRIWGVDKEKLRAEVEAQSLDPEKLYKPRELISPSQAEELFGKALFRPASEKKAAGPLAHLIEKPRGSPVLAAPDDKRPSMIANPDEELEEA